MGKFPNKQYVLPQIMQLDELNSCKRLVGIKICFTLNTINIILNFPLMQKYVRLYM